MQYSPGSFNQMHARDDIHCNSERQCSAVGRSKNMGGAVETSTGRNCSGHNLPHPMIGIGLTYQPKFYWGGGVYIPMSPWFRGPCSTLWQCLTPAQSLCYSRFRRAYVLLTRQQNYFSPPHQ